ncbi:ABC transporter permease (plasmid) [Coraliomargarita sp. W4R53]
MSKTVGLPGSTRRNLYSLWVLSARDLRVRYATSWLGYFWSILDPLVMSLIYWFVFTQIFERSVGSDPYIVFLLAALLPWVWFNASVNDFTRAFQRDSKLVRSTAIPRAIWVGRIIVSKGIEFLLALPVLAVFAVIAGAELTWGVLWFPVAVLVQACLLTGLGLILAPLCILFEDLERTTKLVLRALFYGSPIIYSVQDLPEGFAWLGVVNPLAGIFSMYRSAFFVEQWNTVSVVASVVISVTLLVVGIFVFRALERDVLKEL